MDEQIIKQFSNRIIIGPENKRGLRQVRVHDIKGEVQRIVSIRPTDTLNLELAKTITGDANTICGAVKQAAAGQKARVRDWAWWSVATLLLCTLAALALYTPECVFYLWKNFTWMK